MPELGEAYKNQLEDLLRDNSKVNVYDYCNEDDFKKLWGIEKTSSSAKAIIIVWDGRNIWNDEDHPSLLLPHLTPVGWALAFSIKKSKLKPIHIVDLTGKERIEWSMRMRDQLLAEMPWVLLYAPLVPLAENGKPLPFRRRYREILGFNKGDKALFLYDNKGRLAPNGNILNAPATWTNGSQERLKYLAKQWVASLTRSDDHHDINNVMGARFMGQRARTNTGVLEHAFRNRLQWSGLEPKQAGFIKNTLDLSNLEVVVIDDHVNSGWGDFVKKLIGELGGNGKGKVFSYTDDVIPDLLNILRTFDYNKRKFSLRLIDKIKGGDPEPKIEEIILLDLRMPKLAEKASISALLNLAEQANGQLDDNEQLDVLAWKGFDEQELTDIEEWVRGERSEEEVKIKALLLLPRLLSLALPLTPIVLFSATGQAWIREKLRPYRNILTNFEKPRPLSDPDSVKRAITNLVDCIIKGLKMQQLRLRLAHVQSAQNDIENARQQENLPENNDDPCIEIYADEVGTIDEGITSALAFCYFPSGTQADALQNELENEAGAYTGQHGIVNVSTAAQTTTVKFIKSNGLNFNNVNPRSHHVERFNDFLLNKNVDTSHWYVVATKADSQGVDWQNRSLDTFPDAKLDAILRFNLEFALFVLVPYLFRSFNGNIHINLATRGIHRPNNVNRGIFYRDFNLYEPRHSDVILTWIEASGFPITRGWLSQWSSGIHHCIKQLKTAMLKKNNRDEYERYMDRWPTRDPGGQVVQMNTGYELPPKPLHNIADWAAGANNPGNNNGNQLKAALKDLGIFPCGQPDKNSDENLDGNWFTELEANKVTDAKLLIDALRIEYNEDKGISPSALLLILQSSCVRERKQFNKQQSFILWKMKDKLEKAKGDVLHLVCDSLEYENL